MSNNFLHLFGAFLWVCGAFACKMEYEAAFNEDIYSCSNFENKMVDADGLKLSASDSGEGEKSMSMSGSISLKEEIKDGYAILVEIYKETELVKEFVNGARWDICSNLNNKDAPWFPLLECLGVAECPISVKEYGIDELKISLDSAKNVMTHEFCGDYKVHMSIVDDLDVLSCHIINIAIVENPGADCIR